MNRLWILFLSVSLIFKAPLYACDLLEPEQGDICVSDMMKMVWTHPIDKPSTPLQVAEVFVKHSPLPMWFKNKGTVIYYSKGPLCGYYSQQSFSLPFLRKTYDYVVQLFSGISPKEILAQEKAAQAKDNQGTGPMPSGRPTKFDVALDATAPPPSSEDLLLEDISSAEESSETDISTFFPQNLLSNSLSGSPRGSESDSFASISSGTSLLNGSEGSPWPSIITSEGLRLTLPPLSFSEVAEFFQQASLKEAAPPSAPVIEKKAKAQTSPFKELLDTPLALVFGYIASIFALLVGTASNISLGLGGSFVPTFSQVRYRLALVREKALTLCERILVEASLLPGKAFVKL